MTDPVADIAVLMMVRRARLCTRPELHAMDPQAPTEILDAALDAHVDRGTIEQIGGEPKLYRLTPDGEREAEDMIAHGPETAIACTINRFFRSAGRGKAND